MIHLDRDRWAAEFKEVDNLVGRRLCLCVNLIRLCGAAVWWSLVKGHKGTPTNQAPQHVFPKQETVVAFPSELLANDEWSIYKARGLATCLPAMCPWSNGRKLGPTRSPGSREHSPWTLERPIFCCTIICGILNRNTYGGDPKHSPRSEIRMQMRVKFMKMLLYIVHSKQINHGHGHLLHFQSYVHGQNHTQHMFFSS